VNARSALFDLFGDHLRDRGGAAPVAALVRLLAPLDVAGPAVRTAVSRMVRQGWITPVRLAGGPGYRLTHAADRRLRTSAERIYRQHLAPWDGRWHLLVVETATSRARRDRVRDGLRFLGYAPLGERTWISPRASDEVRALLAAQAVRATTFFSTHDGEDCLLAASAWDLDELGTSYTDWLGQARAIVGATASVRSGATADELAYTLRSRLVHEWRKFLFSDPLLPRELLPRDWPGDAAATFFDSHARRLLPAADRFVDACLGLDAGRVDHRVG
jgi:phenylacetic acid degradation operon negative regulatory protein